MKTIKYAVAAVALTTLSFGAFAAQSVSPSQASGMNKIGVVSAEGATTLDGLEAQLAEKAAAAGASGYTITSANTNNKLSGTAVIYK
jgi:ABC-type phosphate transport system substrate-binding protein